MQKHENGKSHNGSTHTHDRKPDRVIRFYSNGCDLAINLISELEDVGWRVKKVPQSKLRPYAESDDGRSAKGSAQIRRKFVGYE
jgi:hypothetical protein